MRIAQLTSDLAEPCLDLVATVFAGASSLHRVVGLPRAVYRDWLRPGYQHNIAQRLSAVCLDDTGQPAACMIACDMWDQGQSVPLPRMAPVAGLLETLESAYRAHRAAVPGQSVLIDMAAVRADCARRGLYKSLRDHVQDAARARGYSWVVGELSSAATQHVVHHRLGHPVIARIAFADFEFDGTRPFADITDPPEIWLTEGALA